MAVYPGGAASDDDLYVAVNNKSTTLVGALTASGGNYSATEIEVSDTTGFPATGLITIDLEIISYTGVATSPHRFTGITRGQDGTTAVSHLNSVPVYHFIVAAHHNVLKDEIKAIEDDLLNTNPPVRLSGTETITGLKTFSQDVTVTKAGVTNLDVTNSTASGTTTVRNTTGGIGIIGTTTNHECQLVANSSAGVVVRASDASASIRGTTTNDSASAGFVGERVSSTVSTGTSIATTNTWVDTTSISLTAGDWDISAITWFDRSTANWTGINMGISTSSGNAFADSSIMDNFVVTEFVAESSGAIVRQLCIPVYRVSIASTTTYYLKARAFFSSGNPSQRGRITARRIR